MKTTILALLLSTSITHPQIANTRIINGHISASSMNNYTYIDTIDGNGWALDYDSNFKIGDKVIIVFDNMGTSSIYDDEILNIIIK